MKLTDEQLKKIVDNPVTIGATWGEIMAAELLTARADYARLEEAYNEKQRCLMGALEAHNRIAADLAQTVGKLGEAKEAIDNMRRDAANDKLAAESIVAQNWFGGREQACRDMLDKFRTIVERG